METKKVGGKWYKVVDKLFYLEVPFDMQDGSVQTFVGKVTRTYDNLNKVPKRSASALRRKLCRVDQKFYKVEFEDEPNFPYVVCEDDSTLVIRHILQPLN